MTTPEHTQPPDVIMEDIPDDETEQTIKSIKDEAHTKSQHNESKRDPVANEGIIYGEGSSMSENIRLFTLNESLTEVSRLLESIKNITDAIYDDLKKENKLHEPSTTDNTTFNNLPLNKRDSVGVNSRSKTVLLDNHKDAQKNPLSSTTTTTTTLHHNKKRKIKLFDKKKKNDLDKKLEILNVMTKQMSTTIESILNEKFSFCEESQRKYYIEPRYTNVGYGKKFSVNFNPTAASVFYNPDEAVEHIDPVKTQQQ